MNLSLIFLLGLALTLAGCVTKGAAQAEARAAFAAGERQALLSMPRSAAQGLTITMKGAVQNPTVEWTPEMTLAKALAAAVYVGKDDPKLIIIVRSGRTIQVDPVKLLSGADVPLEPLDVVAIQ